MDAVNQAAFAKLHSVSRKTVSKWKERGWLVLQDDLVDVEASNALLKKYRRDASAPVTSAPGQGNTGNKSGNTTPARAGNKPAAPPAFSDAPETNEEAAQRMAQAGEVEWSLDEARRVKETYLALLNKLEYEQKAGTLIDLELARQVFFELFRGQRDSWLNWPTRVGPEIAADLDVEADKVTEILTAHVHQHIKRLGEQDPDFSGGEN